MAINHPKPNVFLQIDCDAETIEAIDCAQAIQRSLNVYLCNQVMLAVICKLAESGEAIILNAALNMWKHTKVAIPPTVEYQGHDYHVSKQLFNIEEMTRLRSPLRRCLRRIIRAQAGHFQFLLQDAMSRLPILTNNSNLLNLRSLASHLKDCEIENPLESRRGLSEIVSAIDCLMPAHPDNLPTTDHDSGSTDSDFEAISVNHYQEFAQWAQNGQPVSQVFDYRLYFVRMPIRSMYLFASVNSPIHAVCVRSVSKLVGIGIRTQTKGDSDGA